MPRSDENRQLTTHNRQLTSHDSQLTTHIFFTLYSEFSRKIITDN